MRFTLCGNPCRFIPNLVIKRSRSDVNDYQLKYTCSIKPGECIYYVTSEPIQVYSLRMNSKTLAHKQADGLWDILVSGRERRDLQNSETIVHLVTCDACSRSARDTTVLRLVGLY